MNNEPESWDSRRDEIRQRLGSIHARLEELKAHLHDDQSTAMCRDRADAAQRRLDAAQAAASRATVASVHAFRRSAETHGRVAVHYERAAAAGAGDRDRNEQQAAIHRAAQAADIQRAENAQLLALDQQMCEQDSEDVDQA